MAKEKEVWKKEFSAGGVVYKNDNGRAFILLVNPKKPNFGPPQEYWTFPKGRIDEGESKEIAAIRETREEGGVNGKIVTHLGQIKYFRNSNDYGKAIKFVDYYLMEYIDGNPVNHDEEMADAQWFSVDEILGKLKFTEDKQIFEKAKDILT